MGTYYNNALTKANRLDESKKKIDEALKYLEQAKKEITNSDDAIKDNVISDIGSMVSKIEGCKTEIGQLQNSIKNKAREIEAANSETVI